MVRVSGFGSLLRHPSNVLQPLRVLDGLDQRAQTIQTPCHVGWFLSTGSTFALFLFAQQPSAVLRNESFPDHEYQHCPHN
jgi:hypothetical protein